MKVKTSFKRILAVTLLVMAMCFVVPTMAAAAPDLIGGNITSMNSSTAGTYGIDASLPIRLFFDGSTNSLAIADFTLTTSSGGSIVPVSFSLTKSGNEATLTPSTYLQNQGYTLIYQDPITAALTTINFKTKQSGGGGGQAPLYCIGASVDNGTNFSGVASGAIRVPVAQDLFFTFTNAVPQTTGNGHNNSNGILLYEWTGSTTTAPSANFATPGWVQITNTTMVFNLAGTTNRWYVHVAPTAGWNQNTFYGAQVLVPTPNNSGGYNFDGLCANNGVPLQQGKSVVFRTAP